MDFQSIIATRRDGGRHMQAELTNLAKGAADGGIPDYQLAAWLMAAYLKPLSEEETAWLTVAMAESGERLDLTGLPKPWVDKHSTGGVGDKTSLVVLPLLASCGLTIVKMSGRGLGITGGTVDKLESIPGFRTDLLPEELKAQALKIGLALTGQTPDLAPADKTLYALRDATATVDSTPLIVSSVLSKKLAGGAETVVLDVKCGRGAFMPDLPKATELARTLLEIGTRCGLRIRIAISDMDQPLGSTVGNALEVKEAVGVLEGVQSRFAFHCVSLAALTLEACGLYPDPSDAARVAAEAIASGRAKEKARQWFQAQGAQIDLFTELDLLPLAPVQRVMLSEHAGWVADIDALSVGRAVVALGGGRQRKEDAIDPAVGVELHVEVGALVSVCAPLMTIHAANEESAARALESLKPAIVVSETAARPRNPILKIL